MPSSKSVYDVAEMIQAYYVDNPVGGNLHIVTDDDNTSGRHVLFCLRQAERENDPEGVALAEALIDMDENEREAAISKSFKPREQW